jgi:hypothetical protein
MMIATMIADLVIAPPTPKMLNYPGTIGIIGAVISTLALLVVVGKFDPSGGVLAISLLITMAFLGTVVFCLFFSVPADSVTSSIIGGLTAAFGAVVAHWIGRSNGHNPPKQ